jgi:hypothetical protein
LPPEIVQRFLDLAGGKDAPIVFIPTAEEHPLRCTATMNIPPHLFGPQARHRVGSYRAGC